MQDAYISESGTGIGNWKMIGYTMASNSNFKYLENSVEGGDGATATSVELTAGKPDAWQAQNKAALNECPINSEWNIEVTANTGNGGSALYKLTVTNGNGGSCDVLAPSMGKLSTATAGVIN